MKLGHWAIAAMVSASAAAFSMGAEKVKADKDMAVSVEKAGPEFKLQGEYVGDVGGAKLGVQVIALGEGTFRGVFFPGGLPGAGGDEKTKIEENGKQEGDKAAIEGKAYTVVADGEKLSGKNQKGGDFELKKVMRVSPTMGAKPPEGAVVLFDGSSADAWKDTKVDERGLLKMGGTTKQAFEDFTMHLEFMEPFKPNGRGQDRGNSGVYLQERYEVQVLDSFGLKPLDNELGGLYHQSSPSLNMCFPPLSWQTYDIDFKSARWVDGKKTSNAVVTVKLNGVVIQDNVELKSETPGRKKEAPGPGAFYLQDHGNPVFYRNIWVVEKK